jgi:hypothetical protein
MCFSLVNSDPKSRDGYEQTENCCTRNGILEPFNCTESSFMVFSDSPVAGPKEAIGVDRPLNRMHASVQRLDVSLIGLRFQSTCDPVYEVQFQASELGIELVLRDCDLAVIPCHFTAHFLTPLDAAATALPMNRSINAC